MRSVQLGRTTALVAGLVGSLAMIPVVRGASNPRIFSVAEANPSNPPAQSEQPNRIGNNLALQLVAQGSDLLENPSGVITTLGYLNDTNKTRTEPDENTYLVFDHNPGGPTVGYDYGRHFLFQGHENSGNLAYMTRINLDVLDPAHRITLLTPVDATTQLTGFNSVDGSTWNPFTRTLLFTMEAGTNGGVVEITPDWPAQVRKLNGIVGKAGYEGVVVDDKGNLLLIEDVGGTTVNVVQGDPGSSKTARQPNSFVYRFEPYDKNDLGLGGQLFALQVWIDGTPIVFNSADPVGDTFSDAQLKLHTLGTSYPVTWVLLHDTNTDGFDDFDANALAKTKKATPFKRPENAKFLPGSNFSTFFFCPTGDTDANAGNQPELAARGAWGSIFRVHFPWSNPIGSIQIAVLGDADHASFDNMSFADDETLLVTEDRGDMLHDQLDKLDSVWAFDVVGRESKPKRLLALGRDATATDEDNEPTGMIVSKGAASIAGLLGRRDPSRPDLSKLPFRQVFFGGPGAQVDPTPARSFVTEQHGLNQVYEIVERR
jgi:hypothetical protein